MTGGRRGNRQQATGDGGRGEKLRRDGTLPSAPAREEIDLSALTPVQRRIVEVLSGGPLQLDALIDKTGLSAAQVLPQITVLQIKKLITQKPGKTYELSGG